MPRASTQASSGTVLSLKDVSKSFAAVTVADAVSFDLPDGQALGVIGPNGAGKTSLFNLVTGAIKPDSGLITYCDTDVTGMHQAARCQRGIARSFQIPQPFTAMSVFENVLVGAWHGGQQSRKRSHAIAAEVLAQTGLLHKANKLAGSLTLLERKRLELARALAAQPKLLLLDEIAGGLTEHECLALIETIKATCETGVTIIWIEHIVHALLAVVDRLIVIDFGRLIADGDPQEVISSERVKSIYLGPDSHA